MRTGWLYYMQVKTFGGDSSQPPVIPPVLTPPPVQPPPTTPPPTVNPPVEVNLATNPRGSSAYAGYTAGSQTITANVAVTGNPDGITTANRVAWSAGALNPGVVLDFAPQTDGQSYAVSAWVKLESAPTGTAALVQQGIAASVHNVTLTQNQWVHVSFTWVSNGTNQYGFRVTSPTAAGSFLITGLLVQPGTTVNPFLDSGTYSPSLVTPNKILSSMTLGTGAVVQNIQKDTVNGQYFVTQTGNGTSGTSTPYQTTTISRVSLGGNLLDSMTLLDAGHGYGLIVENVGKQVYLWVTYNRPLSSSGSKYDLVRFPYAKGTFARENVPGLKAMYRPDTQYATYDFDWANNWAMERYMSGNTMICKRRKISELNAGVNHVYNTVNVDLTNQTLQGNCTVNNSIFVLVGAANGEVLTPAQPTQIWKYDWNTGNRMDVADISTLGKSADGTWLGGQHEPEGIGMFREADGRPTLIFDISMGASNAKHTHYVYTYHNIGDAA